MKYTELEVEAWKLKAEKWDRLGKEIEGEYGRDVDGEWVEWDDEDEDHDLVTIGEAAAYAYGWM